MNVLSLFDGCSGGQQALERAGIKYNKYYASEIDKYAIQVTQHNYPDTIQLGSVVDVDVTKLEPIDLLIGGSPCQSFSFAGKRNGMTTSCNEEIYTLERYLELKADGFQFEGESYLFWEYMRILTDIRKYNPDVLFLLENVEMGAKWERVLSEAIGIYGVHINSALVSAQNRKRIYWTNIRVKEVGLFGELHSDIPQPEDRGILLKDILEDEVDEKYYLSDKMLKNMKQWDDSGNGIIGHSGSGGQKGSIYNTENKIGSLCATDYKQPKQICVAMRGRGENNEQTLEPQLSGKTNTLTSVQKDNLVMQLKQINDRVDDVSFNEEGIRPHRNDAKKSGIQELGTIGMENTKSSCVTSAHSPKILIPEATSKGYVEIKPGECFDAENINSKTRRGRKMTDKSNCLMAKETDFMHYSKNARIRRLTPLEAERLQTMKDNFTAVVSDTQRYKMIGNGWTIDVIAHIFSFIKDGKTR
jgi:DNA-cytosine methyltransferase